MQLITSKIPIAKSLRIIGDIGKHIILADDFIIPLPLTERKKQTKIQ